jgi:hypothetical protein
MLFVTIWNYFANMLNSENFTNSLKESICIKCKYTLLTTSTKSENVHCNICGRNYITSNRDIEQGLISINS